jgi:adenylate cyclase
VVDIVVIVAVVAVAILLVMLVLQRFFWNVFSPRYDRRHRQKDDAVLFDEYCKKGLIHRFHAINRRLPTDPRCKLCYVPFGGLGKVCGVRPSRKNSNFCRGCFEAVPEGGHDREIGVLFADLRDFTAWSADHTPDEVASALADFYRLATTALMAHDAIIDKFVGDGVIALFLADMPTLGDRTGDEMLAAAVKLVEGADTRAVPLGVGVGLHFGTAWVGNVGEGEMKDFTALGDVVNVASRLQGCASAGQIVISEDALSRMQAPVGGTQTSFEVKGKNEPIATHVLTLTA